MWETSPAGPFNAWPTGGGGFEYFYGFIGGEAHQWYPSLYEGTTPIEVKKTPEEGYHFMEDMTDKAIGWIGQQKALIPDKPFFVYFAPGATHAPHHVPKEWADKYKGKFDAGLGQAARRDLRAAEEAGRHSGRLPAHRAPQGDPGVGRDAGGAQAGAAPPDGGLRGLPGVRRPPRRPPARLARRSSSILDDTLVYYIIGDNGASAEGTLNGTYNEMINFNGAAALETPEFLMARIDKLGGPESYNHYAVGWAHAMNTPYQWTKQVASHWGGTRNGTIVHWPKGIKAKGEMRSQFHHVIDVAPTILEAAGLPAAALGGRRPAEADRRRQHAVLVQRRQGGRAARDPVLRDVRQPRHLPQGLDGGDAAQDAVAPRRREDAAVRRRRLGALRHQQGLEPGEQPGEADAGEAARAAAPVADRGDALQRAAARRPRRANG